MEISDKHRQITHDMGVMDVGKANSYTVEEWINIYMKTVAKPSLPHTSYSLYERLFRLNIIPHFGHYSLIEL